MYARRLLFNVAARASPTARPLSRSVSTHTPPRPASTRRLASLGLASGVLVATSFVVVRSQNTLHADSEAAAAPTPPLTSLLRSYIVYAMCSVPPLVDWSPKILSACLSVPVVRTITEAFVRVTFFDQFVGAETAEDALPLLERFRAENKGCLFAYSVEVDEAQAKGKGGAAPPAHKQIVQEMLHSIDVAADFEDKHGAGSSVSRRTWVAVKLTALVPDHHVLISLSKYLTERNRSSTPAIAFPGTPTSSDLNVLNSTASSPLSAKDIAMLKELRADLDRICQRAQERGVKVVIDAEHSWYQPAIDAYALYLTETYNRASTRSLGIPVQPLIYNTYQAYLRRTPEHLAHSLRAAQVGGYSLGVKLVRGAYQPHETETHSTSMGISPDVLPPVWSTKAETDHCYDSCARVVLDAVADDIRHHAPSPSRLSSLWNGSAGSDRSAPPSIGVMFGTHNWNSCRLVLDRLLERGLARQEGKTENGEAVLRIGDDVTERLALAQLYGMHDNLTDYLVRRLKSPSPCVIKYVPYGSLKEVMPYLSRRAIENKSVLGEGSAAEERSRAWAGIKSKIFGA